MAAIIAIEKDKQHNWSKLWLEMNCILVVNAFSNSNLVPWYIKSRCLICCAYTLNMDFMITHTYREVNFYDDFLANLEFQTKAFT